MKNFLLIIISCFFFSIQGIAQETKPIQKPLVLVEKGTPSDSLKAAKNQFKPSPQKALLYSAVVPGLGQFYNRKYWKVPIVYAGYAALIYAITWNGGYYNDYKKAYVSIADEDSTTNSYKEYIPAGQNVSTVDKTWLTSVLYQKQLSYRRNRDLSIIGLIGFYGLTLLDAYVDAQLYDFDISPKLSMHMEPFIKNSSSFTSTTLGLRWQLTF